MAILVFFCSGACSFFWFLDDFLLDILYDNNNNDYDATGIYIYIYITIYIYSLYR